MFLTVLEIPEFFMKGLLAVRNLEFKTNYNFLNQK